MNDKGVRISFMQLLNDHIDDLKNKPEYKTAKEILKIGKDSEYVINRQMFEYSNDKRQDTKEENVLISATRNIGKNILKTDKKGYSNYERLYNNLNKHPAFKAFFEQTKLKKGDMFVFGNHIADYKTKSMENHEKHNAKQKVAKQQTQKEIETLKGENEEKTKKIESLKKRSRRQKKTIAEQNAENQKMKEELEKQNAKIETMRERLRNKKEEVIELRNKNEQNKNDINKHYNDVLKSGKENANKIREEHETRRKALYDTFQDNIKKLKANTQEQRGRKDEKERKIQEINKKYDMQIISSIENLMSYNYQMKERERQDIYEQYNREFEERKHSIKIKTDIAEIPIYVIDKKAYKKDLYDDEMKQLRRDIDGRRKADLEALNQKYKVDEDDKNSIRQDINKYRDEEIKKVKAEYGDYDKGEITKLNSKYYNEYKQALEEEDRIFNEKISEYKDWKENIITEKEKKLQEANKNLNNAMEEIRNMKQQIAEEQAKVEEIKKQTEQQIFEAVEEEKKRGEEVLAQTVKEERKQAEEDKRNIKADANRDKNEKLAQMKHKMEERHEKEKEELLKEAQQNQKEIYGFAPNLEAYIKTKLASKAYSLDKDELIDKIARDIGKPGGLPKGTNPETVAKAIYDRGAEETLKHIKKIANLALLTGYNNDLYNKLPGDVAQEVQKYITDKINDDIRKKNIKYILPKDKPRWEYAMQNKQLNPMLGRSAWRVN